MDCLDATQFPSLAEAINGPGGAVARQRCLWLPRGTYPISETITIKSRASSPVRIIGDAARIIAEPHGDPMDACLRLIARTSFVQLSGLIVDCNDAATSGIEAQRYNSPLSVVKDVIVLKATGAGFRLEKCQVSIWTACMAKECNGVGWLIIDCNAAVFSSCAALHCGADGFYLADKNADRHEETRFPGGCTLENPWAEANGRHSGGCGIRIDERLPTAAGHPPTPIAVRGGWIESNKEDGVLVSSKNVVLSGVTLREGQTIRLTSSASACHISGCYLHSKAERSRRGRLIVEGNPAEHYIAGNFDVRTGSLVS